MQNLDILKPLVAQAALNFATLLWLFALRVNAIQSKKLPLNHFKTADGTGESGLLLQARRHFVNLHEQPMLFFAIGILLAISGFADAFAVRLAWGYVACRLIHTIIHLTFNDVNLRLAAYFASQVLL